MSICMRCQYMRKESDALPDSHCPACGIAYAKSEAFFSSKPSSGTRPRSIKEIKITGLVGRKFIAVAIAVMLCVASFHQWSKRRVTAIEAAMVTRGENIACKAGQPSVVLYTTTVCAYCKLAKAYMHENNICYTEKVIDVDKTAWDEFGELKGVGVPLIFIGEKRRDGFNADWIKQELKPWL